MTGDSGLRAQIRERGLRAEHDAIRADYEAANADMGDIRAEHRELRSDIGALRPTDEVLETTPIAEIHDTNKNPAEAGFTFRAAC
jgi:hypothetical protein